jgi:hypothetical protein
LPYEDRRLTLQRAYYTYLTNDELFDKEIKRLEKLANVLDGLMVSQKEIAEFNEDPFEMEENEVMALCEAMIGKYMPSEVNTKDKKTLSDADNVELIPMKEDIST